MSVPPPAEAASTPEAAPSREAAAEPAQPPDVAAELEELTKRVGRLLDALEQPRTPEILTASQAADLLQINTKTLYSAAERGQIPSLKIGRTIRFEKHSLLNSFSCRHPHSEKDD